MCGVARIQALDDAQLVMVMLRAIVDLTDEQRALARQQGGQFVEFALVVDFECARFGTRAGSGYREFEPAMCIFD